jgi:hypothetical protein
LTHFGPNNCTITLHCNGRLFPVDYSNSGAPVKAEPSDLTGWYSKNEILNTGTVVNESYPLASGTKGQFVIAVKTNSAVNSISLPFKSNQQTPINYRRYIYYKASGVTVLSGKEDGTEKKVLNFSATEQIIVLVNGVPTTQFDTIYSNASLPKNVIILKTPLQNATNQIEITVTTAAVSNVLPIQFTKVQYDENRQGTGAWENVNSVSIFNNGYSTYKLFFADYATYNSILSLNIGYRLDTSPIVLTDNSSISAADIFALLAISPYSHVDRELSVAINLADLDGAEKNIMMVQNGVNRQLQFSQQSLRSLFPAIKVTTFTNETLLLDTSAGSGNTMLDNSFIKGPDL